MVLSNLWGLHDHKIKTQMHPHSWVSETLFQKEYIWKWRSYSIFSPVQFPPIFQTFVQFFLALINIKMIKITVTDWLESLWKLCIKVTKDMFYLEASLIKLDVLLNFYTKIYAFMIVKFQNIYIQLWLVFLV